ncbi:hypothetical protein B0H13DRAFT_2042815 [Mycena leptocephala]|nr:hypothetical protein B0H13DRAFT_2042815 [Mycena leptocephala]
MVKTCLLALGNFHLGCLTICEDWESGPPFKALPIWRQTSLVLLNHSKMVMTSLPYHFRAAAGAPCVRHALTTQHRMYGLLVLLLVEDD